MTFDIGNWHWQGECPLQAAKALGQRVGYVHCKGVQRQPQRWVAVPLLESAAPWRTVLRADAGRHAVGDRVSAGRRRPAGDHPQRNSMYCAASPGAWHEVDNKKHRRSAGRRDLRRGDDDAGRRPARPDRVCRKLRQTHRRRRNQCRDRPRPARPAMSAGSAASAPIRWAATCSRRCSAKASTARMWSATRSSAPASSSRAASKAAATRRSNTTARVRQPARSRPTTSTSPGCTARATCMRPASFPPCRPTATRPRCAACKLMREAGRSDLVRSQPAADAVAVGAGNARCDQRSRQPCRLGVARHRRKAGC